MNGDDEEPDLFSAPDPDAFGGDTYDVDRDYVRLTGQLARTWQVMLDGTERTLAMIAKETSALRKTGGRDSEAAISARLRDFRKPQFGSHVLISRNGGGGLWWYRLVAVNDPAHLRTPLEFTEIAPPPTNAHYDKDNNLIHDHCAICGKDAAFGVGVSLLKGHLGMWYCREHKPQ
jgi:hypothetical protein